MAAFLRILDDCAIFFDMASYEYGEDMLPLLDELFAEVAGHVYVHFPSPGVFKPVVAELAWHQILGFVLEVHVETYRGEKALKVF